MLKLKLFEIMKVYYVNPSLCQEQDVVGAYTKVLQLLSEDSNVRTITFLVGQQTQFSILAPLGFKNKQISDQGFSTNAGIHVQFKTLRNYHSNYVFSGQKPSEILVPIYISQLKLYQFEDYTNIAYWIIVPWTIAENKSFLSIHEAEDCTTGVLYPIPDILDVRVANALDWLKETSYPNEGYHHPNDENRLKNIAVKLRKMNIPIDYDAVVYYAYHHGFVLSAARKTADYFVKAQNYSMKISDLYSNLESVINAPRH